MTENRSPEYLYLLGFLSGAEARVPSTLVVAAHPDDEVIGLGGQLARLQPRLHVLHVTDGAPSDMQDARAQGFATRQAYADARRRELLSALALAGVGPQQTTVFGIPDQQASLQLAVLARRLAELLTWLRPEYLVAPAYEGGHPDHDAVAFAVWAARAVLRRAGVRVPIAIEFPLYHAGPDGSMVTGRFAGVGPAALVLRLTEEQQRLKRKMVERFATQQAVLSAFCLDVERFRYAPDRDYGAAAPRRRPVLRPPPLGDGRSAVAASCRRGAFGAGSAADQRGFGVSLTVLSVAFPFAPVGEDAAGGAEQVLSLVESGLVRRGHRSIVVACRGSRVAGELIATAPLPEAIDDAARRAAWLRHRAAIETALARERVDLVHCHGLDFHEYLPSAGVPLLATLHLPPRYYPETALRPSRPRTHLACVSASQRRACPPWSMVDAVVPNGVEIESLETAAARGKPAHPDYVAALGRICPEKGFHLALEAARLAGMPLRLAGRVFPYEGHRDYFEQEVQSRLDAQRVFLGPVGLEAKRSLLARGALSAGAQPGRRDELAGRHGGNGLRNAGRGFRAWRAVGDRRARPHGSAGPERSGDGGGDRAGGADRAGGLPGGGSPPLLGRGDDGAIPRALWCAARARLGQESRAAGRSRRGSLRCRPRAGAGQPWPAAHLRGRSRTRSPRPATTSCAGTSRTSRHGGPGPSSASGW